MEVLEAEKNMERTEILEHTGGDETKTIVWPNVNKMYCNRILSLF